MVNDETCMLCFIIYLNYLIIYSRYFVQNEFQADESDEENQSEEDQSDESCKKGGLRIMNCWLVFPSAVKGGSHESHDTSDSDEGKESGCGRK
jgi:hypothetical protein